MLPASHQLLEIVWRVRLLLRLFVTYVQVQQMTSSICVKTKAPLRTAETITSIEAEAKTLRRQTTKWAETDISLHGRNAHAAVLPLSELSEYLRRTDG